MARPRFVRGSRAGSTHFSRRRCVVGMCPLRFLSRAALVAAPAALLAVIAPDAAAQRSAKSFGAATGCPGALADLERRLTEDYVAFPLEMTGGRLASWRAALDRVRERAVAADPAACAWLLREVTAPFRDGHLLIVHATPPDSGSIVARRVAGPSRLWREDDVRRAIRSARAPSAIDGIWRTPGARIAVLPDDSSGARPGRRIGVVLSAEHGDWRPGDVRAVFDPVVVGGDTTWRALVWDDDVRVRSSPVETSRDALLRLAPIMWVRTWPFTPDAFVDTLDPRRPMVAYPDERTAVISVTSFDPARGTELAALMAREQEALRTRARVVIDLRGNEGGSSMLVRSLLPFLWREPGPRRPVPLAVVRSSPSNIAFWERSSWRPQGLLERMRATPGGLVPLTLDTLEMPAPAPPFVTPESQEVFVLVDRSTVSAAEQVVLWARRLGRARIVGAPTGGSIDYQSARLVRLGDPSLGLVLSYPVIASSARLPRGGHNRSGILPDEAIPVRSGWLEALARGSARQAPHRD